MIGVKTMKNRLNYIHICIYWCYSVSMCQMLRVTLKNKNIINLNKIFQSNKEHKATSLQI